MRYTLKAISCYRRFARVSSTRSRKDLPQSFDSEGYKGTETGFDSPAKVSLRETKFQMLDGISVGDKR